MLAQPRSRWSLLSAVVLFMYPLVAVAGDERARCTASGNEMVLMMERTRKTFITNYTGLESDFRSDGDPDTLEIVFLSERDGSKSGVADDGEAMFLYGEPPDEEYRRLLMLAYCLRVSTRRPTALRSDDQ